MRRSWRCYSVLLLAFVLAGCQEEVKFEDGRIPEKYLPEVSRFLGNYRGEFDGQPGTLSIRLTGNYVDLAFRGDWGYDILRGCEASVGRILAIRFSGHHCDRLDHCPIGGDDDEDRDDHVDHADRALSSAERKLESAHFDMYPGHCADHVAGRSLDLKITPTAPGFRFDATVLHRQDNNGNTYFRGFFLGPER